MSDETPLLMVPELAHHIYWHKKEQFQLEWDRYSNWTFFAVAEGKFAYDIGGQQGAAKFPEAVLCPPGAVFKRQVIEPLSFHYLTFNLYHNDRPVTELSFLPLKLTFADTKRLATTYAQLRAAEQQPDQAAQHWSNHLLRDIWNQYWFENLRQPPVQSEESPHTDDPVMARAYRLIQELACGPLSLSVVASSLGLTPVQLTRKYKAAYGASPSEHATSIRIRRACSLLRGTNLSLERIAEDCGYENGFYLSRIFSKRMGMSPSAYRKTYRI